MGDEYVDATGVFRRNLPKPPCHSRCSFLSFKLAFDSLAPPTLRRQRISQAQPRPPRCDFSAAKSGKVVCGGTVLTAEPLSLEKPSLLAQISMCLEDALAELTAITEGRRGLDGSLHRRTEHRLDDSPSQKLLSEPLCSLLNLRATQGAQRRVSSSGRVHGQVIRVLLVVLRLTMPDEERSHLDLMIFTRVPTVPLGRTSVCRRPL